MEAVVIAFLFDFNGLKQDLLFEALSDPMGFHFISDKTLDEHYSVHNGWLLFWYNRRDDSTHVIRRGLGDLKMKGGICEV